MTILLSLHVISTDFCLSTVRNCSEIDHSLPLAVPLSVCKGLICFRFLFRYLLLCIAGVLCTSLLLACGCSLLRWFGSQQFYLLIAQRTQKVYY